MSFKLCITKFDRYVSYKLCNKFYYTTDFLSSQFLYGKINARSIIHTFIAAADCDKVVKKTLDVP